MEVLVFSDRRRCVMMLFMIMRLFLSISTRLVLVDWCRHVLVGLRCLDLYLWLLIRGLSVLVLMRVTLLRVTLL